MAFLGVLTHRKTRRLASSLGISQCFAVGILEALWHVAQTQAKDGGIGRLSNQDIADEMFYDADADGLIWSLVDSGWLEEITDCRLYIRDWHEHSTDTVDNYLARGIKTYANGALPRMKRLSVSDRAKLCAQYPTDSHEEPQKATTRTLNPKPQTLNQNPKPEPISCDQEKSPSAPKSPKRFEKPTVEEIHAYMVERNWKVPNGQVFFDSYEAKGWKVGKSPMKDWKATVRSWEGYEWFKGKASELDEILAPSKHGPGWGVHWGFDPEGNKEAYDEIGERMIAGVAV